MLAAEVEAQQRFEQPESLLLRYLTSVCVASCPS